MSSVWFECPLPPPPSVKDRGVYFYRHEPMRSNVRAALGRGRRSSQSDTPTVWFNPGQQAARCAARAPRDRVKNIADDSFLRFTKHWPVRQRSQGRKKKSHVFLETAAKASSKKPPTLLSGEDWAGPRRGRMCPSVFPLLFAFLVPICLHSPSALPGPCRARRFLNEGNLKTRVCISRITTIERRVSSVSCSNPSVEANC